mgnify:CR=1 FL=1
MGRTPIDLRDVNTSDGHFVRQLYYMLVMSTEGDANLIVKTVEKGKGVEAWRRLCWEFEPSSGMRQTAVLQGLLRRDFGRDGLGSLTLEVQRFEHDVLKWEVQTGKELDDEVKHGILIGGMRNDVVRSHLDLSVEKLATYQALRDSVLSFAGARRT